MWIRSQNKHHLIKADKIHQDGGHIWSDDYITLGKYSTKEKALKVLDMIQERIYKINENQLNACGMYRMDCGFYLGKEYVFQMPQDSEVESNETMSCM